MRFKVRIPDLQLALRASFAAAIAMMTAELLKFPSPVFAFLAAVIVTDLSPKTSQQLGVRRIVATVVGALTGVFLAPMLDGGPVTVGAGILVAMVMCQLIGASEGARVAGYTCGIIVMNNPANAWPHAMDRFLETVLGVLVAWGVSYIPKLIKVSENDRQ